MNRIEQSVFENITDELNTLRDNFDERSCELSELTNVVIDFFISLRECYNKDECIDKFKSYLYMLCDIDIDEELEKRYNEIHLNNKSKSL